MEIKQEQLEKKQGKFRLEERGRRTGTPSSSSLHGSSQNLKKKKRKGIFRFQERGIGYNKREGTSRASRTYIFFSML